MDALRRERALLRTLLFERPVISALLALVLAAGFIVAWFQASLEETFFPLALLAAPVFAKLAISAWRLESLGESAGALGIPGHFEAVRRVQYSLVGLVVVPSIYLLLLGYGPQSSLALCMAGAIAVCLQRVWTTWAVIIAWWVIDHFHFDVWTFAGSAPGALLFMALSVAGFVLWFRAPRYAHARGVWSAAGYADARHETADAPGLAPPSADLAELHPGSGRMRPATFWGALGYLPAGGIRLTATFALTWLAVFAGMHFYRQGRSDISAFLTSSGIAGALAGYRFFTLQGLWATSAGEQSLLVLTPRWPARGALKCLVLRSLWDPLPVSVVAWLAVAITGLGLGWFPWPVVVKGAATLVTVMVALFGFLLLFLAQSRLRRMNRLAMAYLVFVLFTGLITVALLQTTGAWKTGCALLLGAALFPALAFILRRPQFPVRPDGDVVL
jgi:hypothetical protein